MGGRPNDPARTPPDYAPESITILSIFPGFASYSRNASAVASSG